MIVVIAIVGGFLTVSIFLLLFFFAHETYAPSHSPAQGESSATSKVVEDQQQARSMLGSRLSPPAPEHFKRSIIRPLILLVLSPIGIICAC